VGGDVAERPGGREERHVGVADLQDVGGVVLGQSGADLGVDVVPLLDLHPDLGAGGGLEPGVDRGDGLAAEVAVHHPDGEGAVLGRGAGGSGGGGGAAAGGRGGAQGDADGQQRGTALGHGSLLGGRKRWFESVKADHW
jgi:hypothetical protein